MKCSCTVLLMCSAVVSVLMQVSHGFTPEGVDDPMTVVYGDAMEQFSIVTAPGAFLVDVRLLSTYTNVR